MKTVPLPFILSALALGLVAATGGAQTGPLGSAPPPPSPNVIVSFVIPQSADPLRLTYTALGTMYTNTDGTGPGSNNGAIINGALLEPTIGGGLELHGQVPSGVTGQNTPVTEVDFYTNYTGTLSFTSSSPGATPWFFSVLAPIQGYAQGFRYFKTLASQADINDNGGSYAILTATLTNPNDPNNASFETAGLGAVGTRYTPVPEPGTLALLGGLGVPLLVLWRRRAARIA